MQPLESLAAMEHEQVAFCHDSDTGLRSIIAIHSTALGPALGGVRMRPYPAMEDALKDCLRLARGMTYKAAAAGLELGGGKSVIIGDPERDKSEALLLAHGRFIESMAGRYIPGIDLGTSQDDLRVMGRETREVAGVGADPSPITAVGVFAAVQACAGHVFGSSSLARRVVAIQGVGHLGGPLAELVAGDGAELVVADARADRARAVADRLSARRVEPGEILAQRCDILVPCAVGGVINDETIPSLRCRILVGGANNVLAASEHGERLHELGVLYGPDFVANSGGIIFLEEERRRSSPEQIDRRVRQVGDAMRAVLQRAEREGIAPSRAADVIAEERLAAADTRLPRLVAPDARRYAQ